jgi:fumarate reductase flavoprotein subunit
MDGMVSEQPRPDVVIVGAGAAGLACALSTAERGGTAVIFEKSDRVGGALSVSMGQMSAAGARRQAAVDIHDEPSDHLAEMVAINGDEFDQRLVGRAVEGAGATIDWLEDHGLVFDPSTPSIDRAHEVYDTPRTYWPADGGGGPAILAALMQALETDIRAGRVAIHLNHSVTRLLDEDGAIVGVVADGPGGEVTCRAQNTLLATGGYGSAPDLYAELSPDQPRLISVAVDGATGDGVRLSREAGAFVRGAEHQRQVIGVLELQAGQGASRDALGWIGLEPGERVPSELHVNALGQRFLSETNPSPHRRESAVMAQPGQCCWVVFDDAGLDANPFSRRLGAERIRELAQEGVAIFTDPDLRALATKAGIDGEGLERTVQEWNSIVASGEPDPLGRPLGGSTLAKPPFYAALVRAAVVLSFGGLACDADLHVLRRDATPIEGLYAAGEVLGAGALSGNRFWGGMALTPALTFGRLLGEQFVATGSLRSTT